ncbi:protoporphyrinogen oxidase HemJ [Hellea sp.]|nr:protoporphyrinogen oxidase HemJ [Hellea sp.]
MYEWFKALHLIAVIFWMAGLLYLPRLFVYHSASKPGGELEAKMIEAAEKLMRIIMNPAMMVSFILGLILLFGYNAPNLTSSFWLPIKLVFVFALMGYHVFLSKQRKLFADGQRPKSEKFFRRINEIPAIFTIIIVIMAIVKPF